MNEFVDSAIEKNKVVVFSKSYCPYCSMAKDTLTSTGVHFEVLELDERGELITFMLFFLCGGRGKLVPCQKNLSCPPNDQNLMTKTPAATLPLLWHSSNAYFYLLCIFKVFVWPIMRHTFMMGWGCSEGNDIPVCGLKPVASYWLQVQLQ